jgi:hypothetical protein
MLPVHTILFPTDFSERSLAAFPVTCFLARDCGARLIVLHVALPPVGNEVLEACKDPKEYYEGCGSLSERCKCPSRTCVWNTGWDKGIPPR